MRLWNSKSDKSRNLVVDIGLINGVAWSPDSSKLAICSQIKIVYIRDIAKDHYLQELIGHIGSVTSVAWSPDGRVLATGSHDKIVRIWDAESGRNVHVLSGHNYAVTSVAWSMDGRTLASGSNDKTARLWNAATGKCLHELKGHTGSVKCAAWNPDGRTLATVSSDKTVRLWDVSLHQHPLDGFRIEAISSDDRMIAKTKLGENVRLFDFSSGKLLHELEESKYGIDALAWSPNSHILATYGGFSDPVRLWDASTGRCCQELSLREKKIGYVLRVVWHRDCQILAIQTYDAIVLWNAVNGKYLHEIKGTISILTSSSWSPDGRMLATGGDGNSVILWNTENWKVIREFKGQSSTVTSIAWSPDGRTLATGSLDTTVRLWNMASGEHLQQLQGHKGEVATLSWSQDGRTLATGSSDNTVRLWDVATGQSPKVLKGHTSIVATIAWNQDGRTLATASKDKSVRLWDANTGQFIRELKVSINTVGELSWSPDGRTLFLNTQNAFQRWESYRDQSHPEEKARLKRMNEPKPDWHREQAQVCESQSNWFAAAFHLRRAPQDAAVKARLAAAEAKLRRETAPPPQVSPSR